MSALLNRVSGTRRASRLSSWSIWSRRTDGANQSNNISSGLPWSPQSAILQATAHHHRPKSPQAWRKKVGFMTKVSVCIDVGVLWMRLGKMSNWTWRPQLWMRTAMPFSWNRLHCQRWFCSRYGDQCETELWLLRELWLTHRTPSASKLTCLPKKRTRINSVRRPFAQLKNIVWRACDAPSYSVLLYCFKNDFYRKLEVPLLP